MEKKTQIEVRRQALIIARNVVLALTGISGQEYAEHQYICGLKYLDFMCQEHPEAYEEMSSSKIYWNWWKNQWMMRDEDFANPGLLDINPKYRAQIWREYHCIQFLTCPDTEGGKMMEDSFAQVIGIIIKESTQKK